MTRRLLFAALVLLAAPAFAQQPALRPTVQPLYPEMPTRAYEPGSAAAALVVVTNGGGDAMNPVIRMTLPEGGVFTGVTHRFGEGALCTTTPAEIVCEMSRMRAGEFTNLEVRFITPEREDGGTFPFVVSAKATVPNAPQEPDTRREELGLRRVLVVSHAGDDGAGSLRQAIVDARTLCAGAPCRIAFRHDPAAPIQPRTPLPELRGEVKIDGGAARAILDGSLLAEGDALRYESGCEFRVLNLVIRNFNGHAIEARQSPEERRRPECGTSFTTPMHVLRSELHGNVRGVVTKGISATIADNVIRDQKRAGVFVDGSFYTEVTRNIIVANGASGVFLHAHSGGPSSFPPGADVHQNVIRANGEWGVCRTMGGEAMIGVWENDIADNGLYGYDAGLDLSTPNRPTQHDPGVPNKPVLFSATYDAAANRTIIRGRVDTSDFGTLLQVDLYASHRLGARGAYPQAERWLGRTHNTPAFEVSVPGDLRGQWITATNTRAASLLFATDSGAEARGSIGRNTSELSDPIEAR